MINVLKLFRRQSDQSAEQDHHVAFFEILKTGNVVHHRLVFPTDLLSRINLIVLIQTEKDCAVKPVMPGKQFRYHRH